MHPKTLAIDYGTKRIGLALSILSMAEPLQVIGNYHNTLQEIQQVCDQEGVEQIIVGVSEKEMAQQSRSFGQQVTEATGLPVEYVDEAHTSKIVHQKLRTGSAKLKTRRGPIDHFAAAEMLQEWLDSQPA